MDKIKKFFIKNKILFLLILFALLLRIPWLYSTMERDEGLFGFITVRLLSGSSIYPLDNKPPLLYLLYALPISIFGNSIIPVRLFNNLLFFISIIFFFSLIKNVYGKKLAISSSIFYIIFMNLPAYEGPLAVSESFMVPFFIASVYFFSLFLKKQNCFHLGLSIILMCAASLIRHNALGGLLLIYFLLFKKKKLGYKEILVVNIPSVLFTFLIIYFFYTNQISPILKTISNLHTIIPFSYSLLVILESSFILLFAFVGIVAILKKKQTKKYLLIILWPLFLIPFLFFPRSFHHLLTFAPPLAIFAGLGFNFLLKRKKEKIFIIICIFFLILSLFLIIKQYPNYHFKLKKIEIKYADLKSYKQQIQISEYIKNITSLEDKIFVWGNEPGIYWLSERKSFEGRIYTTCEAIKGYKTQELFEKALTPSDDLKAIIFLPGYQRKCDSRSKEIFLDLLLNYNKIKIDNVEIYIKLNRNH